ncbi:hypothetical protein [Sediminicoccus sp. KRV36]|uniref:hypothetical protein n=1 Tax=Sediminicoccus sp. KRV36 TaxID=3133721 RepID=UPI00200BEE3B|nr:hypothetical protein [Sediminicoccus rosea]UPY38939.1 hypothetical protein LHU95_09665 [Sediminicoccus rosea]
MALSARAEPDGSRSLGHARLILGGVSAAAATSGYRIRREGYQTSNLGQRGWQVSEEVLRPVAIEEQGGEAVLILGPRMTRHMEPGPVHLILPGLGETGLFWPETIEVFDGELPPDPVIPQEPPERLVTPRPAQPADDATVILRPAPPQPIPAESVPAAAPRKLPVVLMGMLLLLVVAAGVAWWMWPVEDPAAPPPPPLVVTPVPSAPPPPAPLQPQAAIWPDGTDDLSPRDVVGRANDAAAIFAVAMRRQAAGHFDDALVLMEEAAARRHAPAMTALGRLYDPIGFVPGRPFRTPDPRAAARQYAEAERAGDATAAPLRVALRAWLQQQADGGNASATTTLREFW